jgi:hypothetical protein
MTSGRDDRLIALLPARDSPYYFDRLSQPEKEAFEEALADGFGSEAKGYERLSLPADVKPGVLRHFFFVSSSQLDGYEDEEEERSAAFWSSPSGGDMLAPFESFPLEFVPRRLRIYFENQFDRFRFALIQNRPSYAAQGREWFEEIAFQHVYKKPWYEAYALQFLDWIPDMTRRATGDQKLIPLTSMLNVAFSGQLGRLVEQYYWKFIFEGATLTGLGARKGAGSGGKAKAKAHKSEQAKWQEIASEVWARHPYMSKMAVAEIIRRQLKEPRTAKHIARYLKAHGG